MWWGKRWTREWYSMQADLQLKTILVRELIEEVKCLRQRVHELELRTRELKELISPKKQKKRKVGLVATSDDERVRPFQEFTRKRRKKS